MKLDKDIGTVQNEAAMVATYAVEMFMEKMVNESHDKAKKRGRNTVKYEDLAEVRASHSNMSFLNTLIP
jgi:histone H3/H4